MHIQTELYGDILIFKPDTDIMDADNAREFKDAMMPILKKHGKILFDMTAITFLDSSGCGAVLSCLKSATDKNGDLKVFGLNKNVRILFELVRLHKIIEIFDTKEKAVASFLPPQP